MNIHELLKQALSDEDINNFFHGKVKIFKYCDLKNMTSIDDLIKPYGLALILFEITDINMGHWTMVQKCTPPNKKPFILFFDSYGIMIENEMYYIPKSMQHMTDQKRGYLLKLLYNQPLQVHYNQHRLQALKKGVNDCGKWCCLKGISPDIDEDEFAKLMRSGQPEINTDDLCCLVYESFLQEE